MEMSVDLGHTLSLTGQMGTVIIFGKNETGRMSLKMYKTS